MPQTQDSMRWMEHSSCSPITLAVGQGGAPGAGCSCARQCCAVHTQQCKGLGHAYGSELLYNKHPSLFNGQKGVAAVITVCWDVAFHADQHYSQVLVTLLKRQTEATSAGELQTAEQDTAAKTRP